MLLKPEIGCLRIAVMSTTVGQDQISQSLKPIDYPLPCHVSKGYMQTLTEKCILYFSQNFGSKLFSDLTS